MPPYCCFPVFGVEDGEDGATTFDVVGLTATEVVGATVAAGELGGAGTVLEATEDCVGLVVGEGCDVLQATNIRLVNKRMVIRTPNFLFN